MNARGASPKILPWAPNWLGLALTQPDFILAACEYRWIACTSFTVRWSGGQMIRTVGFRFKVRG